MCSRIPALLALSVAAVTLAIPGHGSLTAVDTVIGTYVDSKGINWAAQPPTPIVDISVTAYSHAYIGFYLPSLKVGTQG